LLNACLTVRAHNANSHANQGWEQFTSEVLRAVSKTTKGTVFVAWGSPAQKRIDSIGVDKEKHCILRAVHPSPLSAARGFFDCKHFVKANEWLRNRYGIEGEVEWDCLGDGKEDKGLPPQKPLHAGNATTNVKAGLQLQKTSKGDLNGSGDAKVAQPAVVADRKKGVLAIEDSDEFEDEELDKMLSSEI
jgi:uracil-DNA glycosylase